MRITEFGDSNRVGCWPAFLGGRPYAKSSNLSYVGGYPGNRKGSREEEMKWGESLHRGSVALTGLTICYQALRNETVGLRWMTSIGK